MKKASKLAVFLAVVIAGCAGPGGQGVKVQSYGAEAPTKPPGCAIEVLRKRPTRVYQALGEISTHLTSTPSEGAISVTFPKACELGADAVIVQMDQVLNEFDHRLIAVTPIRWVVPETQPEEPAPAASASATPELGPVTITTTITTTTTKGVTRTTTTVTTTTAAPEPAQATTTGR